MDVFEAFSIGWQLLVPAWNIIAIFLNWITIWENFGAFSIYLFLGAVIALVIAIIFALLPDITITKIVAIVAFVDFIAMMILIAIFFFGTLIGSVLSISGLSIFVVAVIRKQKNGSKCECIGQPNCKCSP